MMSTIYTHNSLFDFDDEHRIEPDSLSFLGYLPCRLIQARIRIMLRTTRYIHEVNRRELLTM